MTINRAGSSTETVGSLPLTTRNAGLEDLANILREQQARKVDVVVPATSVRADRADWVVEGAAPEITADGVTAADGRFRPTTVKIGRLLHRDHSTVHHGVRSWESRMVVDRTRQQWQEGAA